MQDNCTEWDVALICLTQFFGLVISIVYFAMLSCFFRCYLPAKCLNAHSSRGNIQQRKLTALQLDQVQREDQYSKYGTSGDNLKLLFSSNITVL